MNSAAIHSAKLIAEFEHAHHQALALEPHYPSPYPFGASAPGPFGGAAHRASCSPNDAFAADNEMANFADWDARYVGGSTSAVQAADTTIADHADNTAASVAVAAAPAHQPRALTQYDYPGGWGAQTFNGVGGLTQDSAARIATLQAKLNQRLGPEYLSQRPGPGGGKKLTYIEGWKLVDLANEVFGFNGWSTTIVRLDVDFLDASSDGTRFNAGVSCVVRVTLRDGAFHEDIGYGSADNARQKAAALEKGKKEAVTDATKRALKNFGKLLGNCTYDHHYAANALKVANPAPKFDPTELHRRAELRPPPPPPPQPNQHVAAPAPPHARKATATNPPVPAPVPAPAPAPAVAAAASRPVERAPATNGINGAAPGPSAVVSAPTTAIARAAAATGEGGAVDEETKDAVAERQQRSMLARQAYLERQQAEARKPACASSASAPAAAAAAEVEFGSDSFDDGLSAVLAVYDEGEAGAAEAASHALEMEIDVPRTQDDACAGADDSGVAFPEAVAVKPELRRSTSPVKHVKSEAAQLPRRAGSVGRFVSPPPAAMRSGVTSLSAASAASAAKGAGQASRRMFAATLDGMGGGEGAVAREAAGRANGEPTGHAYVPAEAARGVKRPSETAPRPPPPAHASVRRS